MFSLYKRDRTARNGMHVGHASYVTLVTLGAAEGFHVADVDGPRRTQAVYEREPAVCV